MQAGPPGRTGCAPRYRAGRSERPLAPPSRATRGRVDVSSDSARVAAVLAGAVVRHVDERVLDGLGEAATRSTLDDAERLQEACVRLRQVKLVPAHVALITARTSIGRDVARRQRIRGIRLHRQMLDK